MMSSMSSISKLHSIHLAASIANSIGIQVVQLKKLCTSNTSEHDSGCKVTWNEYLDLDIEKCSDLKE